jgi:hypothetical protein
MVAGVPTGALQLPAAGPMDLDNQVVAALGALFIPSAPRAISARFLRPSPGLAW